MSGHTINFNESAIVVAHPDDEVLWFGSLLTKVSRVIVCYGPNPDKPERASQRRRVVESYPLNTLVFFDLTEPGNPRRVPQLEERDRGELASKLSAALADITTVFTHNAWGEYGHPDHLRVHAVVNDVQRRLNFKVFASSYMESRQIGVLKSTMAQGVSELLSFPVDKLAIESIVGLYKRHNCWTWFDDWAWPESEHFFTKRDLKRRCTAPIPVNIFEM